VISLEISSYCHECPDFEASVDKILANERMIETLIRCSNRDRCRAIYRTVLRNLQKKATEEAREETT